MIVDILEVKAQFSNLIDRVYHGERVVVAKSDLPVADLVPYTPEGKGKLGILKGRLDVPDEARFEADADIERMFYGDGDGGS